MQTLISDTHCLMYLNQKSLLKDTFRNINFVIPDVMLEGGISFSDAEKEAIQKYHEIRSLCGNGVDLVGKLLYKFPSLILADCFALVIAEQIPSCTLIVEDIDLRTVAISRQIDVLDLDSVLKILTK
jgi:hypothetical protein